MNGIWIFVLLVVIVLIVIIIAIFFFPQQVEQFFVSGSKWDIQDVNSNSATTVDLSQSTIFVYTPSTNTQSIDVTIPTTTITNIGRLIAFKNNSTGGNGGSINIKSGNGVTVIPSGDFSLGSSGYAEYMQTAANTWQRNFST